MDRDITQSELKKMYGSNLLAIKISIAATGNTLVDYRGQSVLAKARC